MKLILCSQECADCSLTAINTRPALAAQWGLVLTGAQRASGDAFRRAASTAQHPVHAIRHTAAAVQRGVVEAAGSHMIVTTPPQPLRASRSMDDNKHWDSTSNSSSGSCGHARTQVKRDEGPAGQERKATESPRPHRHGNGQTKPNCSADTSTHTYPTQSSIRH